MPITIKRVIKFIITNNTIINGAKPTVNEAQKKVNYAKKVMFTTRTETHKTLK